MARNSSKIGGPAGSGGSKQVGIPGLGSIKRPSRMPASGSSLHNSAGSGNQGPAAAPSGRKSNPKVTRKVPFGEQNEDTGNIRKTGAFKALMTNLKNRSGVASGKKGGSGGKKIGGFPVGEQNDTDNF